MTKKHFIKLAAAIKAAPLPHAERKVLAEIVTEVCASVNKEFRRSVFMDAAGVA